MQRKMPAIFFSLLPIFVMTILLGPLTFVLLNRYFSWSFLRLGLGVSGLILMGTLVNLFLSRELTGRIKSYIVYGFSLLLSLGTAVFILLFLLLRRPFFLAFGLDILFSYVLILFLLISIINLLIDSFNLYQKTVSSQEKKIFEERRMRHEMERKLHSSRINPHFLFNSLNLMVSLLDDKKRAEEVLMQLSDLLRYNLDAVKLERISLKRELEIVQKYMDIQVARFGDRLIYHLEGEGEFSVPPMILQPLVENSIKHNMRNVKSLDVRVLVEDDALGRRVSVYDSAAVLCADMAGTGTGLTITAKRMELMGGSLEFRNGGVVLCFP